MPHDLNFQAIDKKLANSLIKENHYTRRSASSTWCWGIMVNGECKGVLTIGKPCSWSTCVSVVGEKKGDLKQPGTRNGDVYEFNRLWVDDSLPRNTESKFIAWCLRELKKIRPSIILVSYADREDYTPQGYTLEGKEIKLPKQPHTGAIYRAVGWTYTGLSAKFVDLIYPGFKDHRSVPKKMRGPVGPDGKRAWAHDPNVLRVERTRKHTYVWCANPEDKKIIAWPDLGYGIFKTGEEKDHEQICSTEVST